MWEKTNEWESTWNCMSCNFLVSSSSFIVVYSLFMFSFFLIWLNVIFSAFFCLYFSISVFVLSTSMRLTKLKIMSSTNSSKSLKASIVGKSSSVLLKILLTLFLIRKSRSTSVSSILLSDSYKHIYLIIRQYKIRIRVEPFLLKPCSCIVDMRTVAFYSALGQYN